MYTGDRRNRERLIKIINDKEKIYRDNLAGIYDFIEGDCVVLLFFRFYSKKKDTQ
jgi:hypothetical protein